MSEPENAGQARRQKLLVPTSFSRKSELALEFALEHSSHHGAEVYLFHVIEQKSSNFRLLDRINEEMTERMRVMVMTTIERLHARGIPHAVEQVHRRLSQGKIWTEIEGVANGIGADMIIMGVPQEGAFKRLITRAPCTMVLVTEKDAGAANG